MMNPTDFTFENLSEMKFNDLYKLSVQLNLVKKRAKKQELIEKLLLLKAEKKEESEWKDGSEVFKDFKQTEDEDRRLTFNVEKESEDRRLTFEVPQEKSILFNNEDARETYEVAQSNLIDSRATFEVSEKLSSASTSNSRGTYDLPKKNIQSKTSNEQVEKLMVNEEDRRLTFDVVKEKKIKSPMKIDPKIKMLTIPITRLSRRTRKDHESPKKDDNSSMRISKKSIAIKKPTKDVRKSPLNPRVKLVNIQAGRTPLTKSRTALFDDKSSKKSEIKKPDIKEVNKENVSRPLTRRKSKTEDNALIKKANPVVKVSFLSPQISNRLRSSMPSRPTLGKNLLSEQNVSKIPKPTKMPDFANIHKKQFEQMDSLLDYKRKKEERARKLFGTPQPGPQNKSLKKPTVFQFRSSNIPVKPLENKFGKSLENLESRNIKKDAVKNKTAPRMQTDIKDRNRSHIHGVRTNKRFELQMRFRNL